MLINVSPEELNTPMLTGEQASACEPAILALLETSGEARAGFSAMLYGWQLYQLGYTMTKTAVAGLSDPHPDALRGMMGAAATAAFTEFDSTRMLRKLRDALSTQLAGDTARPAHGVEVGVPLLRPGLTRVERSTLALLTGAREPQISLLRHTVANSAKAAGNTVVHLLPPGVREAAYAGVCMPWPDTELTYSELVSRLEVFISTVRTATHINPDVLMLHSVPVAPDKSGVIQLQTLMKKLRHLQHTARCAIIVCVPDSLQQLRTQDAVATAVLLDKYLVRSVDCRTDNNGDTATEICDFNQGWAVYSKPVSVVEGALPAEQEKQNDGD